MKSKTREKKENRKNKKIKYCKHCGIHHPLSDFRVERNGHIRSSCRASERREQRIRDNRNSSAEYSEDNLPFAHPYCRFFKQSYRRTHENIDIPSWYYDLNPTILSRLVRAQKFKCPMLNDFLTLPSQSEVDFMKGGWSRWSYDFAGPGEDMLPELVCADKTGVFEPGNMFFISRCSAPLYRHYGSVIAMNKKLRQIFNREQKLPIPCKKEIVLGADY